MVEQLFSWAAGFITKTISAFGYPGVAALMAIESACVPMPSEIIAPFAGYLVHAGEFSLLGVATAGAVGSLAGSWVTYWIGRSGGRALVERYGKYLLIHPSDLIVADRFFAKYGQASAFIGRLLPVVRTFISLPAGMARVKLGPFLLFSFVGSFIWTYLLAYAGMKLGQHWDSLHTRLRGLDLMILAALGLAVVWWVWKRKGRSGGHGQAS